MASFRPTLGQAPLRPRRPHVGPHQYRRGNPAHPFARWTIAGGLPPLARIRPPCAARPPGRARGFRPHRERTAPPAHRDALGQRPRRPLRRLGRIEALHRTVPPGRRPRPFRPPPRRALGSGETLSAGKKPRRPARFHGPSTLRPPPPAP